MFRRGLGRNELGWWIIALVPVVWGATLAFGLTGLIVALVGCAIVVVGNFILKRRNLDAEKIIGGIIGMLGGPYHPEYEALRYTRGPGESSSTVDHSSVSGEGWYDVNDLAVWGLQAGLIAAVLCPVVAAGYLIRRRRRPL